MAIGKETPKILAEVDKALILYGFLRNLAILLASHLRQVTGQRPTINLHRATYVRLGLVRVEIGPAARKRRPDLTRNIATPANFPSDVWP